LWYSAPATDWEREALPIGNGAMGAMVFGGIDVERLQFNEKTLWTGGPGSVRGYDFGIPQRSLAADVSDIAATLDREEQLAPEAVAARIGRKIVGYGDYQSFGDVRMDFADSATPVSSYRRELDLSRALARVRFERDGVNYSREYFVSYPDAVIVMRLTADQPGRIDLRLRLDIPNKRTRNFAATSTALSVRGSLHDNGLKYAAHARVIPQGGQVRVGEDHALVISGADALTVVIAAGTDYRLQYPRYRGVDPEAEVIARVQRAAQRPYAELLARHLEDHQRLFERVALDVGQSASSLPTNEVLSRYGTGDASLDRALESLYFQFGRYLLIASSRPGSLPANLQGVWNHHATPPWNADYHVNINLQMNYWLAETTNLSEAAVPLFDFIDALIPSARVSARQISGARGWTLFLNTNVWGFSGVIDWPTAFWQPEAGAWLAQHYFEHYRFNRDERFLRERAWPVMKEAALYWLDALHRDPRDGSLVVSPSYSPEHGPFVAGAAMSQQIVADLFNSIVEVAPRVGEAAFGKEVQATLAQLDSGLRIGSWGQLQEWKADRDDRANTHRHASHLFALHPGRQISPHLQPELARAARTSLEARGDGGTGWSQAWKVNFWARLHEGDRAHQVLGAQLRASTLPNLLDTHPPFQIDGNFGATAGIAEMLLQSHQGELHILPALPSVWRTGSVKGLRARDDLTLDIDWSEGRASSIAVRAGHDTALSLRTTLWQGAHRLVDADSDKPIVATGSGDVRTFLAQSGRRYVLEPVRPAN
jgi:alpha-L-fucosidase 2